MNRLQYETSPYLLQHASNPVDWYPWGEEAFQKAKRENKPILVSIGYSTCHWCHVMERESFEHEGTARMMNEFFVNIKVDREERPDVDQIYMEAIQYLGVSGGWPLNCFLTPDQKPFYGGTYFPPKPAYKRPSWEQVLIHIHRIYEDKRKDVERQADRLIEAIQSSHTQFLNDQIEVNPFHQREVIDFPAIFEQVKQQFDIQFGGIGRAPKFPSTMMLQNIAMLGRNQPEGPYLKHFLRTLERMATGGIYDQIGGGFSRYSVDREWHVPHFEKMLYDNALLLSNYALAYQLTGDQYYEDIIDRTIQFLMEEMQSGEGTFFAAFDADSEGIEGKFYVWSKEEFDQVLGENAALFGSYYQVSEKGNWEETNILFPQLRPDTFAAKQNIDPESFQAELKKVSDKLYHHRKDRIAPGLDDKIIVSWNALLIKGLVDSHISAPEKDRLQIAEHLLQRIFDSAFDLESGRLYHLANGKMEQPGFLDDYAFLIRSCLAVYLVNGENRLLLQARRLTEFVLDHFLANPQKIFYFTEAESNVVVRKIELYDQALPSGNAVMAENLWHLGKIFDEREWIEMSVEMIAQMKQSIEKYPGAFAYWLGVWMMQEKVNAEVVVIGEDAQHISLTLLQYGFLGLTWMTANDGDDRFPLLKGRKVESKTLIYICQDFQCQQPLESVEEALEALEGFYVFEK